MFDEGIHRSENSPNPINSCFFFRRIKLAGFDSNRLISVRYKSAPLQHDCPSLYGRNSLSPKPTDSPCFRASLLASDKKPILLSRGKPVESQRDHVSADG